MEHDAEGDGEHDEQDELEGDHPPDIALAEILEAGGIVAIGLVAEGDEGSELFIVPVGWGSVVLSSEGSRSHSIEVALPP